VLHRHGAGPLEQVADPAGDAAAVVPETVEQVGLRGHPADLGSRARRT
jgi:hypothetical protein